MKKRIVYALGAAAVLLCVGGVSLLGAVRFGWFLTPEKRILLAAANTFRESGWSGSVMESDFLEADGITADFEWDYGGVGGDLILGIGAEENSVTAKAGAFGLTASLDGVLTEEGMYVKIPLLGETFYFHDISKDKEQPLFQRIFGKRGAEHINGVLRRLSVLHWRLPEKKTESDGILMQLESMEFTETEPKTFAVDGNVSCGGYRGHAGEADICVYLYQNKLVAVVLSADGWQCEFLFSDGADEIKVIYSDEKDTRIAFRAKPEEEGIEAEMLSAAIDGRDSKLEGMLRISAGAEVLSLPEETQEFEEMPKEKAGVLENFADQMEYLQNLVH